ncbi:MAG TPA: fimbria/pilus outer membrane usher protein, partial [Candidatus Acidoferrales bacterium]|nr:fimbria/pilus outer membrane usher protein [Candidatus Acidoferrales bacterium]
MWFRLTAMSVTMAVALSGMTAGPALAQTGPSTDVRTFVTLHVNTIEQDETVAILRGDDVLVPVSIFEQAGVHGLPNGKRETYKNVVYVSLKSLAPDVTFKLDVDALDLNITVTPAHLGSEAYDILHNRPKGIEYTTGSSSYVNYAVTGSGGSGSSAFVEGGFVHDQDSFHLSFTAASNESFRRGLVYYLASNRDSEISRVVGDANVSSGDLGGSSYIAGYYEARDFSLDPYAIHFPLPNLSGVVATPSVASVYVNGQLVQKIDLPPGTFNLNQLPVTTGSGNTQVVVTNAFGQSQTYSQQYYAAAEILAPGTSDFQYAAGLLRQNAFAEGDSYGPAAAVGRYRTGVTNTFTVGGRLEATPQLVSAGPEADFEFPFGLIHTAVSASDDRGLGGVAASLGYSYNSARFNAGLSMLAQGPYYSTISQDPSLDRTTSSIAAFAGAPVGKGSTLSLEWAWRKMRDTGTYDQLSLTGSVPVLHGSSLSVTAERDTSTTAEPQTGISAALNFSVGSASATVTGQVGTTKDESISIQDTPETRYGLGYNASYDPAYGNSLNASLLYRSAYGNAELDYGAVSGSASSTALRLAGGLAFIDHGIFLSPPITQSYALVDVPGTPGVAVYLENQYVGKTNAQGKLLVPDLLPNFGNPIRIDDKDVPFNTSIQTLEKLIAPPVNAGAVVTFAAERLHAITGTIVVERGGAS